jgi:hypothetical protein
MYFLYRIRFLIFLLIVVAVAGGIYYFISQRTYEQNLAIFETQVEAAVATAVENALINVTRTAEAPLNTFQLIQLGQNADLAEVARQAGTTLELLQVINGLGPEVRTGNGEVIVVPSNITEMTPPRQIQVYEAQIGDTLASIAERNTVDLALLQADNPILAQRGLHPGDTVFIGFRIFNR